MGGGNGAKAAQKRERNAEKNKKPAGSQLKANEAAKTITCAVCKQAFLGTMRKPALTTHAEVCLLLRNLNWIIQNKHSVKFEREDPIFFNPSPLTRDIECFPGYVDPPK